MKTKNFLLQITFASIENGPSSEKDRLSLNGQSKKRKKKYKYKHNNFQTRAVPTWLVLL